MSKQANKTAIGVFVVGAVVLAVVAIIVFGSGKFFVKTDSLRRILTGIGKRPENRRTGDVSGC